MTLSVFNNNHKTNNGTVMISSLPLPPNSNSKSIIKMPGFMLDPSSSTTKCRKRSAGGLVSNGRSITTSSTTGSSNHELKPLLYHQQQDEYYLPHIHNVVSLNTLTSSPSPPSSSRYYYSSPTSSIGSPSTPSALDEEDILNSSIRRKGSIASLLNSDPELKQLDEEESRSNYQSHFFNNYPLKRKRPINEIVIAHKKQRMDTFNSAKQAYELSVENTTISTTANESARAAKGLRHFSKQVCDKVAKKGITTYDEVADELAFDIRQKHSTADGQKKMYDQKNIRRRVYDALNVLMAMNIVAKDKKVITWIGIPDGYRQPNGQDNSELLLDQIKAEQLRSNQLLGSLQMLRNSVNSALEKHVQIRTLISRNQSQTPSTAEQQRIELPSFVICASSAR